MSARQQQIVLNATMNTDLSFTNSNYLGCNLGDSNILEEIPGVRYQLHYQVPNYSGNAGTYTALTTCSRIC